MTLAAGTRLGRYAIVAPLGAGGMGEVYRARDTRLGRDVAVKVLPERLAGDAAALARFEREAQTVAALSHPNILAIHDVGAEGGIAYAVTELLEGETLRERLSRGPQPWRRAAEIGAAIADGLASAHARGVVHRDIKPENVFLTADGRVKVLDFGLARAAASDVLPDAQTRQAITEAGTIAGTPGYMSPEQVRGRPLDARSDVFALGCVLHEMVTGTRAFAGDTSADVMAAVLNAEPASRSRTAADLPIEFDRIVAHCLEKDPAARFHSAHDVAFALKAALSGSVTAGAPEPAPARRTRVVAMVLASVAVLVAGVAIAWFAGVFDRREPAPGAILPPVRSIAVLPFAHTAGDADAEFLSYAITLNLTTSLAQVRDIEVRPHSSVTGQPSTDAMSAGKRLRVQTVLTGSIQTRRDDLLIACELVDVATNRVRWAQVFNLRQADLVSVQQELARTIAGELHVGLTSAEQSHVARRQTGDRKALELFVLGRREWNRYVEAGFRKSIELYEQALERDPGFALAYSGLADSYIQLGMVSLAAAAGMPRAKQYAEKALALDPTLAEAHVSLGTYFLFYERDRAASKRELDEAIALSPNYADAFHFRSHQLQAAGRADEAVAAMEQAVRLDPTSLVIGNELALALYLARRFEESVRQYRRGIDADPPFTISLQDVAAPLAQLRRFDEGVQLAERGAALDPRDPFGQLQLAYAYAAAGRHADLERLRQRPEVQKVLEDGSPTMRALILIAEGQTEAAMHHLEEAAARHDPFLFVMKLDARFDPVRSDPRFRALFDRIWK